MHTFVRAAAREAGMALAGALADGTPLVVEVFAARAGHTTDWHFDFMDNFTVQLRGRSRVCAVTPRALPTARLHAALRERRRCVGATSLRHLPTRHFSTISTATRTCRRRAGRGAATGFRVVPPCRHLHRVEALDIAEGGSENDDDESLAINISLVHTRTYADVVCVHSPTLWQNERWRQGVNNWPGTPLAAGAPAAAMRPPATELAQQEVAAVAAQSVTATGWRQQPQQHQHQHKSVKMWIRRWLHASRQQALDRCSRTQARGGRDVSPWWCRTPASCCAASSWTRCTWSSAGSATGGSVAAATGLQQKYQLGSR